MMLMLSSVEVALCFLQMYEVHYTSGYSVIFIRMTSDVKERKITLLKLEKAEMSHTRRLLCRIARYLAVD